MSAKTITPAELKEWHRLREEFESATEVLLEPQQRAERARVRLNNHLVRLNRKYVIREGDDIDQFGAILRAGKKPLARGT